MRKYGEQGAFFDEEPYVVAPELTDVQREYAEEKAAEKLSMERFESERNFGQGVLETLSA